MRLTLLAVVLSIAAAVAQPLPPVTNRLSVYFAATSVDGSGLESDYSSEVSISMNDARGKSTVTLAWDHPAGWSNLTYRIYRGNRTRTYTTNFNAGHTNQITIPIFAPRLTNLVVWVTSTNATNILWAPSLDFIGPWQLLGTTNWRRTNDPPRMFRAIGRNRKGSYLYITNWTF